MKIPVFIICRDRLTVLKRSISSYLNCLGSAIEIVIHDNASTFPPTINYLNELESSGVSVYRNHDVTGNFEDISEAVARTINLHGSKSDYYIVTDPDIELDYVPADFIDFYRFLLTAFPQCNVVGPMLRIDDIPDTYPLKSIVIDWHSHQFWHKEPSVIEYNGRRCEYQHAPIDTTFGMFRREYPFRRLSDGIRTYAPYVARHLDWYVDPKNMTEDQIYYMQHASTLAHWSASYLKKIKKD